MGLRYQEDKGLSRDELIKKIHIMLIYNPAVAECTTCDATLRLLSSRKNPLEAKRFLIGYNLAPVIPSDLPIPHNQRYYIRANR